MQKYEISELDSSKRLIRAKSAPPREEREERPRGGDHGRGGRGGRERR